MKVTFKNNSSSGIAYMGRPIVEIPGHQTVDKEFPEGERTEKLLAFLGERYPTLEIVTGEMEGGSDAPAIGAGSEGKGQGEQDGGDIKPTVPMPPEEFAAKSVVKEGGAGWHTVTVEGIEAPIKVRVPRDSDKTPVDLAYAEYAGQGE